MKESEEKEGFKGISAAVPLSEEKEGFKGGSAYEIEAGSAVPFKEGFKGGFAPLIINQGTFGCIYHPGINCNHKPQDMKYVTKIHASNERTTQNEINISKKIQTIKDYEMYFSPVLENCKVDLAEVDREDVEKCKFIQKDIQNNVKSMSYMSTKIKYIEGDSLYKYVEKQKKKVSANKLYSIISFLYKTLCTNVKKMSAIKVVHYDLKENNIIVTKRGIPIIIDFGISIDMEKIKESNESKKNAFYVYSTDYDPWCIEIVLINYLLNKKDQTSSDDIMRIFDELIKKNELSTVEYLKDSFPEYRENFKTKIADKYAGKPQLLEYLLSTYEKWDLYSVTMMFIQILKKTETTPDANHISQIKNILYR